MVITHGHCSRPAPPKLTWRTRVRPFCARSLPGSTRPATCACCGGNKVLTLHSELASHAFRGIGWEGTSVDPYTTSAGRTLLSAWDTETITRWWDHFPHQATPTSAPSAIRDNVADWPPPPRVTLAGLLDHVDAIRRHGYGSVDEEFEPGLVGVSAPVYGFRGDIIAAINVSAPKQRLGAHLDEAGKFTRSIADQMSTALGAP